MEMEFILPIYQDMPKNACAKPDGEANPNNYLASLTVGKKTLDPAFDGDVTEYRIKVGSDVETVKIKAEPVAKTSTVSGIGEVSLEKGSNTFQITCTSAAGSSRVYTLTITRK